MYARFGKRALDLAASGAGLLLLSPLLLVIACAVALSSPGPVVYFQRRLTRGGREFWIWKFRTLLTEPPVIGCGSPDQSLLTPIGGFLRDFYLDELLQLVNVFRGEMSLIGPRPWEVRIAANARTEFDPDNRRYGVRAGMLGFARATLGVRPAEWEDYRENVLLDIEYAERVSFGLDLWIVLKSIGLLFGVGVPKREAT